MAETDPGAAAVLRARAQRLARSAAQAPARAPLETLTFTLAHEIYGVEMRHVREVQTLRDLTPVPCTPRFVLGILSVRGELCPVVDLKRLLGLPDQGLTNATRAVILRDGELEFAIVADTVTGVRAIDEAALRPAPAPLEDPQAGFLRGVTADGLIVLDAPRVLGHPSMIVKEEVASHA